MIHVDLTGAAPFFGAHTPDYAAAEAAHRTLSEKTGAGSDFLGWTELPRRIRETELLVQRFEFIERQIPFESRYPICGGPPIDKRFQAPQFRLYAFPLHTAWLWFQR